MWFAASGSFLMKRGRAAIGDSLVDARHGALTAVRFLPQTSNRDATTTYTTRAPSAADLPGVFPRLVQVGPSMVGEARRKQIEHQRIRNGELNTR
jgi:hypothetical protein